MFSPLNKVKIEITQQGESLKPEIHQIKLLKTENRKSKKLHANKRKSASKRFLRQHANELKKQRDFNNFLTQNDIGTINEIESISNSDSSVFNNFDEKSAINNESYQIVPFENMKKFDINKAFQLLTPQQVEK